MKTEKIYKKNSIMKSFLKMFGYSEASDSSTPKRFLQNDISAVSLRPMLPSHLLSTFSTFLSLVIYLLSYSSHLLGSPLLIPTLLLTPSLPFSSARSFSPAHPISPALPISFLISCSHVSSVHPFSPTHLISLALPISTLLWCSKLLPCSSLLSC